MSRLKFFFRPPNHQRFEYNPRFWNPDKEDLERRLHQSSEEKRNDTEAVKARISSGFRKGSTSERESTSTYRRTSNLRLVIIVGFLILMAYLLIEIYVPRLLQLIDGPGGSIG